MDPANPTASENKEPLPPADPASLQGKEPAPPNQRAIPDSSDTPLGMLCMILFLVMFVAFALLLSFLDQFKGAYEYATHELQVCSWITFSAAAILTLLYPSRKKEIARLPVPKPMRTGCLLGCSAPILAFFGLLAFVGLVFERLFPALPILVGIPLLVLFLLWLNKAPNASPSSKTRTLRLFIPYLPFLLPIGLFLGIAAPNFVECRIRYCSVRSETMAAREVKSVWGEPLWSSEEAMIYATKKDQLVVLIFSRVPAINVIEENSNPQEVESVKRQAPYETPRVVRIAKLENSGEFVESSRTEWGRGIRWIGYKESAPGVRLIDSTKASAKARERLAWLIDSGTLKDQIAKTPAIVSKSQPTDIQSCD